jgi:predicted PurR-regulated permease PerM
VVPRVVDQIGILIDRTPSFINNLQHNQLVQDIDERWHVVDKLEEQAKAGINEGTVTSVFGGVLGAGKAVLDGVVAAFTVLILTLYFMVAMPGAKTAVYKLAPRSRRERVVYLGEEMSRRVGGYVLGQLCVAIINGVLAYIMLIILGLPFAVVLAVVLALLAFVPLVGTIIGGVLVISVALSVSWVTALIAFGYYVAYHVFESYVLAPRIMQRAVEVPGVITVVAILAGGTLLGVIGALIAIPVAASLLLLYEEVVVPRQQSR